MALIFLSVLSFTFLTHAQNPQCARIVTLTPAATELLWTLGLSKNLVGVSEHSDYPSEAKHKPNIGGYQKPSLEKILSLKPTLIAAPNEGVGQIHEQFKKLGLTTIPLSMRTLDEIPNAAEKIMNLCYPLDSKAIDQQTELKLISKWRQKIESFNEKKIKPHFSFVIEVQAQPLMVAGPNTFLNQLFTNCGGKNLVSQNDYSILSLEKAYTTSPDVVFRVGMEAKENLWTKHPNKKIKLVTLDPNIYSRPSPRLIDKLGGLCAALSI